MSELLDDILELQQLAFRYFLDHTNARNGLVADNTRQDSACSIAATGLGLSCYPVAVNNGWLKRADAAERVLTALRFFEHSPQIGVKPDGRRLADLGKLIDAGKLRPLVQEVFPLEDAKKALELSRSRHVGGKIVLSISEDDETRK
jgi:NADPH:quinone reductase-like Zn-dependent oxidoreductase